MKDRRTRKENRAKSTIFGWDVAHMSSELKIVYMVIVIVILAGIFWLRYNKATKKEEFR